MSATLTIPLDIDDLRFAEEEARAHQTTVPELVAMMCGVSLYEVEITFEDSLRQLVGWSIYSFVAAVEVSGGGNERRGGGRRGVAGSGHNRSFRCRSSTSPPCLPAS